LPGRQNQPWQRDSGNLDAFVWLRHALAAGRRHQIDHQVDHRRRYKWSPQDALSAHFDEARQLWRRRRYQSTVMNAR
jgi:hypothetical protein